MRDGQATVRLHVEMFLGTNIKLRVQPMVGFLKSLFDVAHLQSQFRPLERVVLDRLIDGQDEGGQALVLDIDRFRCLHSLRFRFSDDQADDRPNAEDDRRWKHFLVVDHVTSHAAARHIAVADESFETRHLLRFGGVNGENLCIGLAAQHRSGVKSIGEQRDVAGVLRLSSAMQIGAVVDERRSDHTVGDGFRLKLLFASRDIPYVRLDRRQLSRFDAIHSQLFCHVKIELEEEGGDQRGTREDRSRLQ